MYLRNNLGALIGAGVLNRANTVFTIWGLTKMLHFQWLRIYIIDTAQRILCAQMHFLSLTVMILSFRTDRSGQTVQTQIRLLLEEQSDQGLNCLLFQLHLFDETP